MKPVLRSWLFTAIVALLAANHALAAAPLISATLEPRQIGVGESAQLTITSSGSTMQPVNLPEVQGLDFRIVGQSRRIEIINGATLATTSIIVRVTPQSAGIFTIPGITPKSQPLVLRVNPDNGTGSSSGRFGSSNGAGLNPGGTTSSGIRMSADGSAFVRFNLPKRQVYVGESIPVDIEVGMKPGFVTSLNGLPTLTGTEFTLDNLSHQPERVEKLIDGKPFTVLTWHSVLAPVKPGTFTLSVETPLTVRVRTQAPKDSMIDDLLGDPFLQNFFGATVPKDITVASQPAELTVLALPTEGRPADFSGAVGSFKIATDLSATTAATGDPLTLRLHVSGAGNFDRVDSPMLEHLDQWKTYPPKSSFKSGDVVGYKGDKSFEQPLVASQPGTQTIPPLSFSYFDPTARKYETLHSAPITVSISRSAADSTVAATPAAPAGGAAPPPASAKPAADGLQPDHATGADRLHSLLPVYLHPAFLAFSSLLALAFTGGWLILRRRNSAAVAVQRRRERLSAAAKRALADMERAAQARDAARFLTTARDGLRESLAARWQLPVEAITTEELQMRLDGGAFPDPGDGARVLEMFILADEANYSGHTMSATDFDHWLQTVRRQFAGEEIA